MYINIYMIVCIGFRFYLLWKQLVIGKGNSLFILSKVTFLIQSQRNKNILKDIGKLKKEENRECFLVFISTAIYIHHIKRRCSYWPAHTTNLVVCNNDEVSDGCVQSGRQILSPPSGSQGRLHSGGRRLCRSLETWRVFNKQMFKSLPVRHCCPHSSVDDFIQPKQSGDEGDSGWTGGAD